MLKVIGIALLVSGLAGLAVGTLEHTQTRPVLKAGSVGVRSSEPESFTIPPLAAGPVAAVGLVLFLASRKA
jgi:hypothetical protein